LQHICALRTKFNQFENCGFKLRPDRPNGPPVTVARFQQLTGKEITVLRLVRAKRIGLKMHHAQGLGDMHRHQCLKGQGANTGDDTIPK